MINMLSLVFIFLLSSPSEGFESGDLLETLERLSQRVEVLEEEGRLKDERIVRLEAGQVHLYECAWQNQWGFNYDTARDDVVKFDNLFFQESSITNTTSLDIRSGVFTCKVPGVYQVTFSLNAHDNTEHTSSFVNLYKNDNMIEESYIYSSFGGDNYNWGYEMSARTMFVKLDLGDQVYLYCENYQMTCFERFKGLTTNIVI